MKRRQFLSAGPVFFGFVGLAQPGPEASSRQPIPEPHFPSRLHQFVWRNWELATSARMAQVIRTSVENVLALGYSMGLPTKRELTADQLRRIYVTVIRQNWHLLPDDQLIALLGWSRERYEFTLKEEDALNHKLGPKPACPEVTYRPPTGDEQRGAGRIRQVVHETLGGEMAAPGGSLFRFIKELSDPRYPALRNPASTAAAGEVDLSDGWVVTVSHGQILGPAARRLEEYLRLGMKTRAPRGGGPAKSIRLAVDTSLPLGAFRLGAGEREIHIIGHDEASALQGIYWMQDQMELREGPFIPKGTVERRAVWNPRYLYSYFALYGDPLSEPEIDPFPDGYIEKLARAGINGVWIQAVLNTLAPAKSFPEFGSGWERRLANLNALVRRAAQFGLKVYLYINEPRGMPDEFFHNHAELRGSSHGGLYALCTSVPLVRDWIRQSLTHVFRYVPELGGIFAVTMSENHTNCFSHGGAWRPAAPNAGDCSRCVHRNSWETIGELIDTFRDGMRRAGSQAELIVFDWGWGSTLAERLIPLLPKDAKFSTISEWDQPVHRGGVSTVVGEFSISVPGLGPRAQRNWALARKAGLATMADEMFNNTWEISAVPYIPVPHLTLERCENLAGAGISAIMASWTLGGYPSPILEVAKAYYWDPRPPKEEILTEVAARRYGRSAVMEVVEAWQRFSTAFQEFPYGVAVYLIPTQHGPANLLRLRPTGQAASMLLYPQDDFRTWCRMYPPETVYQQFAKMAALWKEGVAVFEKALRKVASAKKSVADHDLAIMRTCYTHFQSTANQVEFYLLRAKLDHGPERQVAIDRMRIIVQQEIELAKLQFQVTRTHSTIAYEASNHYYYTPLGLVEKILNCRQILDEMGSNQ